MRRPTATQGFLKTLSDRIRAALTHMFSMLCRTCTIQFLGAPRHLIARLVRKRSVCQNNALSPDCKNGLRAAHYRGSGASLALASTSTKTIGGVNGAHRKEGLAHASFFERTKGLKKKNNFFQPGQKSIAAWRVDHSLAQHGIHTACWLCHYSFEYESPYRLRTHQGNRVILQSGGACFFKATLVWKPLDCALVVATASVDGVSSCAQAPEPTRLREQSPPHSGDKRCLEVTPLCFGDCTSLSVPICRTCPQS